MKKEAYKHNLPHFQQPGQAYFVTWILKDAVPLKALKYYSHKLEQLKNQIEFYKQKNPDNPMINELKSQYYKVRKRYINAYDALLAKNLNNAIDLSKQENLKIITEALH